MEKNTWPFVTKTDYDSLYSSIIDWPKISLVIPSFNQGEFIDQTINSIVLQKYPNIEIIIIDGGSRDNTVEVVNKFSDFVDVFISESDQGQSDAINKGWNLANGEIFNWLNSDDYLSELSLYNIALAFIKSDKKSLLVGNVLNFDSTGNVKVISQKNITFLNLLKFWDTECIWHQPGIFVPSNLFGKSILDLTLHYAMDLDLLLDLTSNANVIYLNKVIHHFRIHNNSKGVSSPENTVLEKMKIVNKYYNGDLFLTFLDKINFLIWIFKICGKLILRFNFSAVKLVFINSMLLFIRFVKANEIDKVV